ncbi:MAG: hypothetical protein HY550_10810 [Elusimicrobia bacterium]|nr:hypothetical protein [Elusimicrobiota bacterium]
MAAYRPDAGITLALQERMVDFLAEVKTRTAPGMVAESLWRIKNAPAVPGRNYLLLVPYLTATIVEMLNREKLSGLDLNGNYLIQTPGLLAMRLDRENRFPESQPIKNIFAGASSLVGRLLLARGGRFGSVNEVARTIQMLGGGLSLSAVSKVLKGLAEELIIEKNRAGIALLQPEKLLQKLGENYRPPKILETLKLKIPDMNSFAGLKGPDGLGLRSWVISGESSARRYAVMADSFATKVYVTDFGSLWNSLDEKFYNVVALRTGDLFPFFDAREEGGQRWASPLQCWLELSRLDKREREISDTVRKAILEGK